MLFCYCVLLGDVSLKGGLEGIELVHPIQNWTTNFSFIMFNLVFRKFKYFQSIFYYHIKFLVVLPSAIFLVWKIIFKNRNDKGAPG